MQGEPVTRAITPSDLAKAKVISGNRITIPPEVANNLGAKLGDELFLLRVREGVWLITKSYEPGLLGRLRRADRDE